MGMQMWQVEIYNSVKNLGQATISQITENIALPQDWVRPNIDALVLNGKLTVSKGVYKLA